MGQAEVSKSQICYAEEEDDIAENVNWACFG